MTTHYQQPRLINYFVGRKASPDDPAVNVYEVAILGNDEDTEWLSVADILRDFDTSAWQKLVEYEQERLTCLEPHNAQVLSQPIEWWREKLADRLVRVHTHDVAALDDERKEETAQQPVIKQESQSAAPAAAATSTAPVRPYVAPLIRSDRLNDNYDIVAATEHRLKEPDIPYTILQELGFFQRVPCNDENAVSGSEEWSCEIRPKCFATGCYFKLDRLDHLTDHLINYHRQAYETCLEATQGSSKYLRDRQKAAKRIATELAARSQAVQPALATAEAPSVQPRPSDSVRQAQQIKHRTAVAALDATTAQKELDAVAVPAISASATSQVATHAEPIKHEAQSPESPPAAESNNHVDAHSDSYAFQAEEEEQKDDRQTHNDIKQHTSVEASVDSAASTSTSPAASPRSATPASSTNSSPRSSSDAVDPNYLQDSVLFVFEYFKVVTKYDGRARWMCNVDPPCVYGGKTYNAYFSPSSGKDRLVEHLVTDHPDSYTIYLSTDEGKSLQQKQAGKRATQRPQAFNPSVRDGKRKRR